MLERIVQQRLWKKGYRCIAAVDEAGRGPLAGPVVAAACIVAPSVAIEGIDDSKRLTRFKRMSLYEELRAHADVLIGVGIVDAETIDAINILQATIRAMHIALTELPCEPDYVLVDGRPIPHPTLSVAGVIGGDATEYAIAAASIIAKETRDRHMENAHEHWPQYGFKQHKGYGTPQHRAALAEHGPCSIHRRSFRWVT